MTDLSEIRTLNNITRKIFKREVTQFHGIIFAVLSSLCYRFVQTFSLCLQIFSIFFISFHSLCSVIVKFLAEISPVELSLFR